MKVKKVNVYNKFSLRLPYYLKKESDKILINSLIREGKGGLYDEVFDFRLSRNSLIKKIPLKDRITKNKSGIEYLAFSNNEISNAMKKLTLINQKKNPKDEYARFEYQNELNKVFYFISIKVKELIKNELPIFLPSLRGADLIRAYFINNGFKICENNTVNYELKRIKLENGNFLVGANYKNIPEGNFTIAIIIDDCIASDVSVSASIYKTMEKYPKIKKIIIAVSAASQKGIEFLQKEFTNKKIKIHFIAATPVFEMSKEFYLLRTPEEGFEKGTQYVGDMGAWAEKLPENFNNIALWNKQR